MSVDTKELRAIAAGLDRPIGAEILRAAADELDELRKELSNTRARLQDGEHILRSIKSGVPEYGQDAQLAISDYFARYGGKPLIPERK